MKLKFILSFTFFTLLLLFYPGDSYYFHIYAYNRNLFAGKKPIELPKINPVPYLKNQYIPAISAEGVYIVDLPSFTPLYQRSEHERFFPASTNKIITALVAYDLYKPDKIVTIKRVITDGQVMGLFQDERITIENLLYGTLVHSGNDAAYALADEYGFDRFVELMNKKAQQLRMRNSHFTNPAGLDDFNQYVSPFDLALAGRELLKNTYLSKIVSTKEIVISDVDFKIFHTLSNVNKLLGEIQGIGGLKTGYTENAGENLVSFYKWNNHQFIIVVVKSLDRFADTKAIVTWINTNVDYINP